MSMSSGARGDSFGQDLRALVDHRRAEPALHGVSAGSVDARCRARPRRSSMSLCTTGSICASRSSYLYQPAPVFWPSRPISHSRSATREHSAPWDHALRRAACGAPRKCRGRKDRRPQTAPWGIRTPPSAASTSCGSAPSSSAISTWLRYIREDAVADKAVAVATDDRHLAQTLRRERDPSPAQPARSSRTG